ncbi:hypothetical protein RSJ42_04160 [Methanosarcina hadiensis]|uniref:hypothetical protein n=1 Tax=Methanosarcina hadiensis TaxID=3078083 RepID=UPI00397767CF
MEKIREYYGEKFQSKNPKQEYCNLHIRQHIIEKRKNGRIKIKEMQIPQDSQTYNKQAKLKILQI